MAKAKAKIEQITFRLLFCSLIGMVISTVSVSSAQAYEPPCPGFDQYVLTALNEAAARAPAEIPCATVSRLLCNGEGLSLLLLDRFG